MSFITYIFLLLLSFPVWPDTYIEKSGNKCPYEYSETKGKYCKSYSDKPKQVLTKTGGKDEDVFTALAGYDKTEALLVLS